VPHVHDHPVFGATASVHTALALPPAVQRFGVHSFLSVQAFVPVPLYATPQLQWYVVDGGASSTHVLLEPATAIAQALLPPAPVHALKSMHVGDVPPVDT
jgi:hypothetical protein